MEASSVAELAFTDHRKAEKRFARGFFACVLATYALIGAGLYALIAYVV